MKEQTMYRIVIGMIILVCTLAIYRVAWDRGKLKMTESWLEAINTIKVECQYAPSFVELPDGTQLLIRYYPIKP